jgi:hypothetical protein
MIYIRYRWRIDDGKHVGEEKVWCRKNVEKLSKQKQIAAKKLLSQKFTVTKNCSQQTHRNKKSFLNKTHSHTNSPSKKIAKNLLDYNLKIVT